MTADMSSATAHFEAIYSTYGPLLRRIAVRKFNVPRGDAEALVHDVFTSYLANPTNVRDLHPYLIGAICNAARQYGRRDAVERSLFCGNAACDAMPSDDTIEVVHRSIVVNATLARLGESCRDTLRRFYLLGESAPAIATSRHTSANYVLRLLHYCRARARAMYESMREESRCRT
jgi:DNA-directed RNA polymerase specialized sigma24 family protein